MTSPASVLALALIFYAPLLARSEADWANVLSKDTAAIFEGAIDDDSVDKFLAKIGTKKVKKIVINSPGGGPIAAMRLGKWVFDNQITVQVKKVCLSSCANYVFTAGLSKIVLATGVVAWHGGAEQKNFRERDKRFSEILLQRAIGAKISDDDISLINDEKKLIDYMYSQKSRPLQNEFFATLKVSEYLTRAGQEPKNFRKLWTFDRDVLKKFGVCNVSVPADYASENYLKLVKEMFGYSIISLELDYSMDSTLQAEKKNLVSGINSCDSDINLRQ